MGVPRVKLFYLFLLLSSFLYLQTHLNLDGTSSSSHCRPTRTGQVRPKATKTPEPSSLVAWMLELRDSGVRLEHCSFQLSKQRSLAIFSGQSRYHPAQLNLIFNPVPLVFYESNWKVDVHSCAIEVLNLDLSQTGPNLEVTNPNPWPRPKNTLHWCIIFLGWIMFRKSCFTRLIVN